MAVSKVILNGTTLIDVTEDTVASSNLLSGYTATGADGEAVTGAYVPETATYQDKTGITPTESSQIITPDSGYDALSSVQIDAISSTYVGSGVTRRDDSDLSVSGATVSVPAGYYEDSETATVASGSVTIPQYFVKINPRISVGSSGLIDAYISAIKVVRPTVTEGYVTSGTSGEVDIEGSSTLQLSTQAAQTITPSTTDQTIASGLYLTGTQTIEGDANLIAENIKSGVTIFGVVGIYSGETIPSASGVSF